MSERNLPVFQVSEELARRYAIADSSGAAFFAHDPTMLDARELAELQADLSEGVMTTMAGLVAERDVREEGDTVALLRGGSVATSITATAAHALGIEDEQTLTQLLVELRAWVIARGGEVRFHWGALRASDDSLELLVIPLAIESWARPRAGIVKHTTPSEFFGSPTRRSYSFQEETLGRAARMLSNHADNTLFPPAAEYQFVAQHWSELARHLSALDVGSRAATDSRTMRVPKSSGGSPRLATQLDPLDGLLQCACVLELAPLVEARRIPTQEDVVHSFRFNGNTTLWDLNHSYSSFRESSLAIALRAEHDLVLVADIENFYDLIPHEVVRRALKRAAPNSRVIDASISHLSSISSRGLPVGPVTSAMYAEAVLAEIDDRLLSKGLLFRRFSDDYVFFCKEGPDAFRVRALLEDLLEEVGLSLHESKTRVLTRTAFERSAKLDAWLAQLHSQLYEDMMADDEPSPLASPDAVTRARQLVLSSITGAYSGVHVGREALRALPLHDRVNVLPKLLEHFERVVPMASVISRSISKCGAAFEEERDHLVGMATDAMIGRTVGDGPNFGRLWLMNAFSSGEWPSWYGLAEVSRRWPNDGATLRELILGAHSKRVVDLPASIVDPWMRRAALMAKSPNVRPGAQSVWHDQLERLIALS